MSIWLVLSQVSDPNFSGSDKMSKWLDNVWRLTTIPNTAASKHDEVTKYNQHAISRVV
jgi:hypothetical protein